MTTFMRASTGTIADGATDITGTMGRIDALRDELETQVILPLQEEWQGDAASAWTDVQREWNEASMAINELLTQIGRATGASAEDLLNAEVANIQTWTA